MHVQNENIPFLRCLFYRFHLWLSGLQSVMLFRRTEQSISLSEEFFLKKISKPRRETAKGKEYLVKKEKSLHQKEKV